MTLFLLKKELKMGSSIWAKAMKFPIWEFPAELPQDVEARADLKADLGALIVKGTDKCLGVVPSRVDLTALPELLTRLRNS